MDYRLPRVAITQGDTNGVGYELIFKALEDPAMLDLLTPIVYGDPRVAAAHAETLGFGLRLEEIASAGEARPGRVNLIDVGGQEAVTLGKPTCGSGEAGLCAIDRALDDYRQGALDVLVTAPLDSNAEFQFSGQSRYIEDHLDGDGTGFSLLVGEGLRIALFTRHLPLRQVAEAITQNGVEQAARALAAALRRDFRLSNPRLAVLALNPKAGEDGALGTEEQEVIRPAIEALDGQGCQVFGPFAADTFFEAGHWQAFDGILAMYYDQALTPFRQIAAGEGCCLTAGLDIVHAAPTTGASFDTAGRGEADATSLRHAIFQAIDTWRNRQEYDEPMANPLKKLYREKREESERGRFGAPKKQNKPQTPAAS